MITVLPLSDSDRKAQLLEVLPDSSHGQVLVMCDGSEELGYALIDLSDSILRIFQLCVHGEDPGGMLADFLMRSCASHAAHFGAYQIEIYDAHFLDFFAARGFAVKEDCVTAPMSEIVRVHKPGT